MIKIDFGNFVTLCKRKLCVKGITSFWQDICLRRRYNKDRDVHWPNTLATIILPNSILNAISIAVGLDQLILISTTWEFIENWDGE